MVTKFLAKVSKYINLWRVIPITEFYRLPRKRYTAGSIKTRLGRIEFTDGLSFISGIQELFIDEIYKVGSWGKKAPVVLDCGANIGLSALYFANTYNAHVYAFEADPNIFLALQKNAQVRTSGKIEGNNKAIWVNSDGVIFDVEGGYSGQIHQHGNELTKSSIVIPSIRLRDLILSLKNIDLLKLDIEGAENSVILDCIGALKNINFIFIEYHSNSLDPQMLGDILNILKNEGFRYHIKEAFTSVHPFLSINEMSGMDLQLNIFAINDQYSQRV